MTTYGLMFKPEMILAYLDDRKCQTRRTNGLKEINAKPDDWEFVGINDTHALFSSVRTPHLHYSARLPYGKPGSDTLYFKETWRMWERESDGRAHLHYRADTAKVYPDWWELEQWRSPEWLPRNAFKSWQPSMLMPKICSRFRDVPILNVRVQRLRSITIKDATDEGCPPEPWGNSVQWYGALWDQINGKSLPWSLNPWVFVYEFPRFSQLNKEHK